VEPDGSVLAALHLQQLKGLNFITRDDRALSGDLWPSGPSTDLQDLP
jgi:hypothetical protein